jgi:predicted HTH transcriptional regulator
MTDEIDPNTQTPQTEAPQESIYTPESISEFQTAQIPLTEPLGSEPATEPELISTEISSEATGEPEKEEIPESEPTEKPEIKSETHTEPNTNSAKAESSPAPVVVPPQNKILELLSKARNAIQTRKRKKLEKIMTLFAKQTNITNNEVEKLLHISDATVTRYLTILKKENKIKQNGKTGKSVSYSKI